MPIAVVAGTGGGWAETAGVTPSPGFALPAGLDGVGATPGSEGKAEAGPDGTATLVLALGACVALGVGSPPLTTEPTDANDVGSRVSEAGRFVLARLPA